MKELTEIDIEAVTLGCADFYEAVRAIIAADRALNAADRDECRATLRAKVEAMRPRGAAGNLLIVADVLAEIDKMGGLA